MALFSSVQPSIRARILPKFPARVVAGSGITITKTGLTYQFDAAGHGIITQVDKGTVISGTVNFTVSESEKQKVTVGAALTVSFSGWPASGNYAETEIEMVNGGAFAVTWPAAIRWLLGDGTFSNTFTAMGVVLQGSGTNHILVWSTTGGSVIWGRAL